MKDVQVRMAQRFPAILVEMQRKRNPLFANETALHVVSLLGDDPGGFSVISVGASWGVWEQKESKLLSP